MNVRLCNNLLNTPSIKTGNITQYSINILNKSISGYCNINTAKVSNKEHRSKKHTPEKKQLL